MAMDREEALKLGGFNERFGHGAGTALMGEENEFCMRAIAAGLGDRPPSQQVAVLGRLRDQAGVQEAVVVSAGGRVLGVTARGATVAEAQRRAYAACAQISFDAMQLRRDIAAVRELIYAD